MTMGSFCFSETNFDQVYAFIKMQIENDALNNYFAFQSYEWHLSEEGMILMKKNNYSLAIIDREKGIYTLAKNQSDNKNLVRKANESFCDLVAESSGDS